MKVIAHSISHGHVVIEWKVPQIKYSPEHYFVHYRIKRTDFASSKAISGTTLKIIGLIPDTDYYYYVEAVNSVGSNETDVSYFKTTSRMFFYAGKLLMKYAMPNKCPVYVLE